MLKYITWPFSFVYSNHSGSSSDSHASLAIQRSSGSLIGSMDRSLGRYKLGYCGLTLLRESTYQERKQAAFRIFRSPGLIVSVANLWMSSVVYRLYSRYQPFSTLRHNQDPSTFFLSFAPKSNQSSYLQTQSFVFLLLSYI